MSPVEQLKRARLERLKQLLARHNDDKGVCARALGKKTAQVYQWVNGIRSISEESARDMERAAGLPVGWFDAVDGAGAATAVASEATEPRPHYRAAAAHWPFELVSPERYARIPERLRGRIDQIVSDLVAEFERDANKKRQQG